MFEVYLCCECLTDHHSVLYGMSFVPFHQCVVMTHFVPSKDIYIYIQVYFLFCVDTNFHCTLYVFEIDLGVVHNPEVDFMKVYILCLANMGHIQWIDTYECLFHDFL